MSPLICGKLDKACCLGRTCQTLVRRSYPCSMPPTSQTASYRLRAPSPHSPRHPITLCQTLLSLFPLSFACHLSKRRFYNRCSPTQAQTPQAISNQTLQSEVPFDTVIELISSSAPPASRLVSALFFLFHSFPLISPIHMYIFFILLHFNIPCRQKNLYTTKIVIRSRTKHILLFVFNFLFHFCSSGLHRTQSPLQHIPYIDTAGAALRGMQRFPFKVSNDISVLILCSDSLLGILLWQQIDVLSAVSYIYI